MYTRNPSQNASLPVDNTKLQIQGFDCFTNSNKSLCHRGVLIHTNKCLKRVAVSFSEVDYREYVYCKLAVTQSCFFHQHVNNPTHVRPNETPILIDLIFTSDDQAIDNLLFLSPLAKAIIMSLHFNIN